MCGGEGGGEGGGVLCTHLINVEGCLLLLLLYDDYNFLAYVMSVIIHVSSLWLDAFHTTCRHAVTRLWAV